MILSQRVQPGELNLLKKNLRLPIGIGPYVGFLEITYIGPYIGW